MNGFERRGFRFKNKNLTVLFVSLSVTFKASGNKFPSGFIRVY